MRVDGKKKGLHCVKTRKQAVTPEKHRTILVDFPILQLFALNLLRNLYML